MACKTFTCFGKLPPEIRIKIYLLATPPRVVSLGLVKVSYDEWLAQYWGSKPQSPFTWVHWNRLGDYFLRSITQIPALLHTCRESREELINYGYELTFAETKGPWLRGPRTWFNYHRDALYLPLSCWTCNKRVHAPCNGGRCFEELFYKVLPTSDKKRIRWVVYSTARQQRRRGVLTGREDMSKDGHTSAPFLATDQISWWDQAIKI